MKKLIAAIMLACLLSIGCGDAKMINGKMCPTYGFINSDQRCKNVVYRANIADIIWSVVLIETIFVPVLILGLDVMEPVGVEV